MRVTLPIIFLA